MKTKKLTVMALTAAISMAVSAPALAGQWKQDAVGWWYDNGNGTYPADRWEWVDGNGDGIAECYYFDRYGYCFMNSFTPDGYWVDANGAWVVNGIVQTKAIGTPAQEQTNSSAPAVQEEERILELYEEEPILKNRFSTKSEDVTHKEKEKWKKVLRLEPTGSYNAVQGRLDVEEAYAEYYTGGGYGTLTVEIAPASDQNWKYGESAIVEIYGGDGSLLYESEIVDYRTNAFEVQLNISGQDSILFKASVCSIEGKATRHALPIIFRDARLEEKAEASVPAQSVQSETESRDDNGTSMELLTLEPEGSFWFSEFDKLNTTTREKWSNGFWLAANKAYVEYYVGGDYTELSFSMAPQYGFPTKTTGEAAVYGDNNELLWKSDKINANSSPVDVTVDISGQDYIKFYYTRNGDGTILFKDAVLGE